MVVCNDVGVGVQMRSYTGCDWCGEAFGGGVSYFSDVFVGDTRNVDMEDVDDGQVVERPWEMHGALNRKSVPEGSTRGSFEDNGSAIGCEAIW